MKPIRTTLILLAVIAVLGAGFFVLLKTEPKETESSPSFTPSPTINIFKTEKENIAKIKDLKVNFISSGALTHSAPILDLSMKNLRPIA